MTKIIKMFQEKIDSKWFPIKQGSLYYQPQTNLSGKSSQNYHKIFASTLNLRPKWVPFNDPWEIYTWSYEMYRYVTSRHLNLFGFLFTKLLTRELTTSWPLPGYLLQCHPSWSCHGSPLSSLFWILFGEANRKWPSLFVPKNRSRTFSWIQKLTFETSAFFSHPISFGLFVGSERPGRLTPPAAWGLYSSNPAELYHLEVGGCRCGERRAGPPGSEVRWYFRLGKMGGDFPSQLLCEFDLFRGFRCGF